MATGIGIRGGQIRLGTTGFGLEDMNCGGETGLLSAKLDSSGAIEFAACGGLKVKADPTGAIDVTSTGLKVRTDATGTTGAGAMWIDPTGNALQVMLDACGAIENNAASGGGLKVAVNAATGGIDIIANKLEVLVSATGGLYIDGASGLAVTGFDQAMVYTNLLRIESVGPAGATGLATAIDLTGSLCSYATGSAGVYVNGVMASTNDDGLVLNGATGDYQVKCVEGDRLIFMGYKIT